MLQIARAASLHLERERERINRLNVFPVPDGDTGTNMWLTLRTALEHARTLGPDEAGLDLEPVLSKLAEGALLGARGNSGTILSQYIQGFFDGARGVSEAGPAELARCLRQASETAYRAVETPEEGTMLTVARAAAEAAQESAERGGGLVEVWEAALARARDVLEETPNMLSVLKEAGVVDAGGEGLVVILDGALRVLRGEAVEPPAEGAGSHGALRRAASPQREAALEWTEDPHSRHAITASEIQFGYCTEFLIKGSGLSREAIKGRLEHLGDSLLVVGGGSLVKVHLHTNHPGRALEVGCEYGQISAVSVANMWEQNEAAASAAPAAPQTPAKSIPSLWDFGVLTVVWGSGFADLLESQGFATLVVTGGSKPSAGEIIAAIEALPQESILLLPNSKDVHLAAQLAAKMSKKDVRVLSTTSEAHAVAAAVCLEPGVSVDEAVSRIEGVIDSVRVGVVARAVRDAVVSGVPVMKGSYFGLVSGELKASGDDLSEVLLELISALGPEAGQLVTLYHGEAVGGADAEAHLSAAQSRWADAEFESYRGGQHVYDYIVSVE